MTLDKKFIVLDKDGNRIRTKLTNASDEYPDNLDKVTVKTNNSKSKK